MQPYLLGNTLLILMYSVYVLQDSGFQLSIVKPNQTNYLPIRLLVSQYQIIVKPMPK